MFNMPLNQLIAKGVHRAFLEECTVTDECVAFRTASADDFAADVVIVPLEAIEGKLQIEVNFWFCHKNYDRMNFVAIDVTKMLFIRDTLSQFVAWSGIRSCPFSDEDVNVALVRHILTDVSDIESMVAMDDNSSFLAEVASMENEAAVLYHAMYAVASGQITNPAELPYFISEGDETEN